MVASAKSTCASIVGGGDNENAPAVKPRAPQTGRGTATGGDLVVLAGKEDPHAEFDGGGNAGAPKLQR